MAQFIPIREKEKCGKYAEWCNLPSLALEKIYSFLSRSDQYNMSLVCKQWTAGFSSPSVWQRFKFLLPEAHLRWDTSPLIKFAERYGHLFKHLEIECSCIKVWELDRSWRLFMKFLEILESKSILISIKFKNFEQASRIDPFLCPNSAPPTKNPTEAIADFLKTQHHLERIEFHQCFFDGGKGFEILKIITERSRDSLKHLVLRGFMSNNMDSTAAPNIRLIASLQRLLTLEVDYNLILENFDIETLKTFQPQLRLKIIIRCERYNDHFLTSKDWINLKEVYPYLEVEIYFRAYSISCQAAKSLIVPEIPVTQLTYDFSCCLVTFLTLRDELETETGIDGLLTHLLNIKAYDSLFVLRLIWSLPIPNLANTFIPFLREFKGLKCFELVIKYPANNIEALFIYLLKSRQSLDNLVIEIYGIPYNECTILKKLASKYVPLLNQIGLNCRVDLKLDPEERMRELSN